MAEYEVMREIYNACAGKWEVDSSFLQEVETDDMVRELTAWHNGNLPPYQVDTRPDGTTVFTFDPPNRQRYLFSEI